MKKKIANHSLLILVLIVFLGLFQAWKGSKNPFAFNSNNKKMMEKSKYETTRTGKFYTNTKNNYNYKY